MLSPLFWRPDRPQIRSGPFSDFPGAPTSGLLSCWRALLFRPRITAYYAGWMGRWDNGCVHGWMGRYMNA
eukprot:667259-Prorocentrum_lima.AAC.1